MSLYSRKYKIRKPGNKRHKSITEQLAADERNEKKRVETARRTTLDKLERREGLWARLKNCLRATFGGKISSRRQYWCWASLGTSR
jgi:NAD dependent epimerase/dehydratase family enzyme